MNPVPTNSPVPTTPKKKWLLPITAGLVVVALAVAGWMWWVAMADQTAEETPSVMISITDSGFSPASVTIKKGQDITWTNDSHTQRQITADQGKPEGLKPDEALNPGDSYSFTFEDAGTYSYHDPANIDRKGVISVE